MEYDVVASEYFKEEVETICKYFASNFKSTHILHKFNRKIQNSINTLKYFPKMYTKVDKKDKSGRYFRRIILNNFIILYTIINENSIIFISRIFYGKMDYFNSNFI